MSNEGLDDDHAPLLLHTATQISPRGTIKDYLSRGDEELFFSPAINVAMLSSRPCQHRHPPTQELFFVLAFVSLIF